MVKQFKDFCSLQKRIVNKELKNFKLKGDQNK